MNKKDLTSLIEELLEETLEEAKKKKAKKKKSSGKKDACYHKVKSRYKVWPSAYASGALVRCRKVGAKNWGKSTNEGKESEPYREEEDSTFTHDGVEYSVNKALERTEKREAKTHKIKDLEWILDHDKPHEGRLNAADLSAPVLLAKDSEGRTTVVDGLHRLAKAKKEKKESIQGKFLTVKDLEYAKCEETLEEKKRKLTKKPSSETNLGDWFKRKGAKGSSGGWVDCNAPDGKGGYKTCGRKKGEKRSKYPACRPTPSACKSRGKGKKWGKKASKRKNESMNNLQQLIESEISSLLNEAKDRDIESIIKASSQSEHQVFFDPSGNVKPEAEQDYKKTFNDLKSKLQNVPTGYIPWIVKTAKGDPEPLPEIITSLKSYIENKSKFGGKKLSALTPGDIRLALEDSNEPADSSNKESSTTVPAGNDQIYNSKNWIGVYPKTKEGSIKACKKLSSGVQWCTAATQSKNYFNEYTGEYNIHLYYFYKKGGKSRSNPSDAIAIGWTKEGGRLEIIHNSNATVNAANRDLSKSDLKEIFGEEWEKIQSAMLQDLGREERKETAFNKIISNLTPETLNAQLEAIDDREEKIETLLNLLKNETFAQNKETTNFAILKLAELAGVAASIDLSYTKITTLPDNLTVDGSLNLSSTPITTLPDNLEVGRDLDLYGSKITTLPDNLTVGGSLNLSSTPITTLPDNLEVGRDLDLAYTPITTLPDNLTVGGSLYLSYSQITTLSDNLNVGGSLTLIKTPITTLPDNLKVGGNLNLSGTSITTLPDNLTVDGSLNLYKSQITTLPDNLKVGGTIFGPDGRGMKKPAEGISESMNNLQQLIENEILSILNESNGKESKKVEMKSLTFLRLTRIGQTQDASEAQNDI